MNLRRPPMRPTRSTSIRIALFFAFVFGLTLYTGVDIPAAVSDYVQNGRWFLAALLVGLNVFMIAAFYAILRHANRWVATIFSILFVVGVLANLLVAKITGTTLSVQKISLAINERGNIGNFYEQYVGADLIAEFIAVAALVFVAARVVRAGAPGRATLPALAAAVLLLATTVFLEFRTGGAFADFVEPYRVTSKIADELRRGLDYRERALPQAPPVRAQMARHIVLIIDESIAYGHLGVNGYRRQTTPYLAATRHQYRNLGRSLSSFNCSRESNYVLLTDVRPDEIPDVRGARTLGKPNIFAYAQAAGYRTMYATSQSDGELINGMTHFDTKFIDRLYLHDRRDDHEDYALIDVIDRFLQDNDRAFAVVVKSGAHFPWSRRKYRHARYQPVPADGAPMRRSQRAAFVNAYDNLIRWTVDGFLEALIPKMTKRNAFVIYTSDHGQNIFDDPVNNVTHCTFSAAIPAVQGFVPILTFGLDAVRVVPGNGYYSHFSIDPTIKYAMGFDVDIDDTFFSDRPRKYDAFYAGDLFWDVKKKSVGRALAHN